MCRGMPVHIVERARERQCFPQVVCKVCVVLDSKSKSKYGTWLSTAKAAFYANQTAPSEQNEKAICFFKNILHASSEPKLFYNSGNQNILVNKKQGEMNNHDVL